MEVEMKWLANWWYNVQNIFCVNCRVRFDKTTIKLIAAVYDIGPSIEIDLPIEFKSRLSYYSRRYKEFGNWRLCLDLGWDADFYTGFKVWWQIHQYCRGPYIRIGILGFVACLNFRNRLFWNNEERKYEPT
jgi:hypothetical protein